MFIIGICIILLVNEFRKLYIVIKNQERANEYANLMNMVPEIHEIDKNFIISEQSKIIRQMKTTNLYNQKIAQHYKELYSWRESCKQ